MAKKNINKNLGIILLVAVIFQFLSIPFIDEKIISSILVLVVGIYLIIK